MTPSGSSRAPHVPGASVVGLTLPQLWAFLAIALPVVAALIAAMSTVDLAYQVRAGQLMIDRGGLLRTDPFTFTAAGQPWLDQQWGAQLFLGGLFDAGGWVLLAAFRAVLVGALFALVYASCREAGASIRPGAWLTLGAFAVSAVALSMRPQLLGMVLFSLTILLVTGRRRHPRWPWAVPIVVLAWANLHGSFFLGPLVVGFAWLEDRRSRVPGADRLLLIAVLSMAATLVNPWGADVWSYAVGLSVSPTIRSLLVEWQVTSPLTFVGAVFYVSVLAVAALIVFGRPRRPPWPALLWLLVLAAIGAYAQRGVVWWALGAPPVVAALLSVGMADTGGRAGSRPARVLAGPAAAAQPERRSRANPAIATAVVLAGLLALPWWRATPPNGGAFALLTDAPPGVTAAVQARATAADRLLAPQQLGSWFEFAAPAARVFVDSRIELFPASVWDDYLALASGRVGWAPILDRWKVTLVVATPDGLAPLASRMRTDPAWRVLYDGDDGTVLARR